MCDKHPATSPTLPAASSRRRRVWELAHACHCPLVGVGVPLATLRKLLEKVTGGKLMHDDYDIHVGAVSECALRNKVSEAIQKELEQRYGVQVQQFRQAKSSQQVGALWAAAVTAGDVAGAFWAALSHPRCTPELEEKMCRDIHMVQHQAGACARIELRRFQTLTDENTRLTRELAQQQARCQQLNQERQQAVERLDADLLAARTRLAASDAALHHSDSALKALQKRIPELDARERLAAQLAAAEAREQTLRKQLAELKQARVALPVVVAPAPPPALVPPATTEPAVQLAQRNVLCVGGRNAIVPIYRSMVERSGAHFAHHDGGLEDSSRELDASLAAADLVICQTGCISHHAYWRVKDHCKRTGKRCVFVDNPSASGLARGLQQVVAVD